MNTGKNMVSIIVPVYNRAAYLEECVESVFAQTYQEFELVLIDDGSTDGSLDLCYEIHRRDPRVRVLETGHVGVSGARNLGLDEAQGEYVFFLDSDDVIHPKLLEALVEGLTEHNAALGGVRCWYCREEMWENVKQQVMQSETPFEYTYHDHQMTLDIVFHQKNAFGQIGGTIMRKDLIGETRFRTDLFIGEDFYFIYENLIKGVGAVFLKQWWYLARIHKENTSWNYGFDGFWTRFKRRELVWRSEEAFGRVEHANRQKQSAVYCFFACFSKNKPYNDACRNMRKVLRQYRGEVVPALGHKLKIMYWLSLYCPLSAWLLWKANELRLAKKVKRHGGNRGAKHGTV